jgi:glycosyltransferase involved in cell wall biosynthesis
VTRLLYFSKDYTPHDYRFLAALADTSFETYYLRLEQGRVQLEDRVLPLGINKVQWSGGNIPFSLRNVPQRSNELRKIIGEIKPNIIHAGPIQSCAFLTAISGFRDLICMSWGYDLLQDADRSWLMRQITRYTLKHSKQLITDCMTVRNKAVQLGMDESRIVTFPWGVNLEDFRPEKYPLRDGDFFTILSTRSWEPIYGVEILAKAFVIAARKDPKVRLFLLGNGSQAQLLREIFEQGGVSESVSMPGQISQLELARYYQKADLYVSASHVDGSSVSLMEALASGRPVLVSDIPGNKEWVEQGINGWCFKDGDIQDLADKIIMASREREKLDGMSIAARKVAEEKADWVRNFSKLLETYETVLSGS